MKCLRFLAITLSVSCVAIILVVLVTDSERQLMLTRYNMVKLGSTLQEAETVIGMERGLYVLSSEEDIEVLVEEICWTDRRFVPFLDYYPGKNYAIMLFHTDERVIGKKLYVIKRGNPVARTVGYLRKYMGI